MTQGYAWVVCEMVLVSSKGKLGQQGTVQGYSKISDINSSLQREILLEHAIEHARRKFLYTRHKKSDDDVDIAVIDSGIKIDRTFEDGSRSIKDSKKKFTSKQELQISERVLSRADDYREDKQMKITQKQVDDMYAKKQNRKQEKKEIEEVNKMSTKELKAEVIRLRKLNKG